MYEPKETLSENRGAVALAIREFRDTQERYQDQGANDSEPDAMFRRLLRDLWAYWIGDSDVIPGVPTGVEWQLYHPDDIDGDVAQADKELTEAAAWVRHAFIAGTEPPWAVRAALRNVGVDL